jgi:glycosyltransferase involved in cell wall biosynthesis
MRIAYMLTSLGIGGAERQAIAIAERMQARGHDVVLIVLRPQRTCEWTTSVKVTRLELTRSLLRLPGGLLRARRILRNFQPDLIHSHTFPANIFARILRLTGAAPRVLSTIHNIYEGARKRLLAYRITDRLSIHTTTVSQAIAERYIRIGAVPGRKCSVIHNGIDLNQFSPDGGERSRLRERFHADDSFVWLAAGRITHAKDYPNLLRAFAAVCAAEARTQLWIAGEAQHQEDSELRTLAAQLGIEDRVRWLGLRDDMAEMLAAADAFVLSSAWEGMPLVIGEAMAMQKPIVATDVGGVRELVGDTGLIVPPGNSPALTQAFLQIMRTPLHERLARGIAARERIRLHFDIDAKVDEWDALYSRLLSARRHSAAETSRDNLISDFEKRPST